MLSLSSKRLFDLAAALLGLLLLAPVLAALAAWVRCDSPGPALYRQWRVGRHGVPFRIYKLRTMRDGCGGPALTAGGDARVTRAGRWLRRHKLDELPQLFNVLLGDMSLVGPRPEVPRYVARYPAPQRRLVLSVAPGITDRAALAYRDEAALLAGAADPEQVYLHAILPAKLAHYLAYVRQRSLWTDLRILAATVAALLPWRPPLRWLPEGRLENGDWRHLALNLLRGLAALQVAAAHLRALAYPGLQQARDAAWWYWGLAFWTGFGHLAVVCFFVISGWLVGGSLLDRHRQPGAYRHYALDRLTRLWTVLLPCFLLMLALKLGDGTLDPRRPSFAPDGLWSGATLLGNLLGLQTVLLPCFGDDFPLWSLANETAYYLLFPLLLWAATARATGQRAAALAAALAYAALLGTAISAYFLLWLLGAGASRMRVEAGPRTCLALWLLLGATATALRVLGYQDDQSLASLPQDLLFGALLALALCSLPARAAPSAPVRLLRAAGTFLAGFSFTLYVLHLPLMRALWAYRGGQPLAPDQAGSLPVYAAMLAATVLLCYLVHLPFEAQTGTLRNWLRSRLAGAAARAGRAAP
ncbi:sugar transferase [Oxalobacteraceae bacterium A2-2]